jgi:hypothetical protein
VERESSDRQKLQNQTVSWVKRDDREGENDDQVPAQDQESVVMAGRQAGRQGGREGPDPRCIRNCTAAVSQSVPNHQGGRERWRLTVGP